MTAMPRNAPEYMDLFALLVSSWVVSNVDCMVSLIDMCLVDTIFHLSRIVQLWNVCRTYPKFNRNVGQGNNGQIWRTVVDYSTQFCCAWQRESCYAGKRHQNCWTARSCGCKARQYCTSWAHPCCLVLLSIIACHSSSSFFKFELVLI